MTTAGQIAAYRFQPREAIPQILTADKDIKAVLSVIKSILEVRDGRSGSKSERFVTLGELEYALSKLNLTGSTVEAEVLSEVMPAKEALVAGDFISVFMDGTIVKARKACSLVDETNTFKVCNGYILDNCDMGADVTVFYSGINTKYSKIKDLTVGSPIYINKVPGEAVDSQVYMTDVDTSLPYSFQHIGFAVISGILFCPSDVLSSSKTEGGCSIDEYNETSDCSAVESVIAVDDSADLAATMTDKAFSTIGGALNFAATLDSLGGYVLDKMNFSLGSEDPDCIAYTYFIMYPPPLPPS